MAEETPTTDTAPASVGDAAQAPAGAPNDAGAVAEGRAGEAEGRVAQDSTAEGRVAQDDTVSRANPRKLREGVVTSAAMDKTAVVTVTERVRHRLYGKTVQRSTKLYVHDEQNECNSGDRVRIQETRPLSKLKRWRLVEVVERAR